MIGCLMQFFRMGELEARIFLDDREMFEWIQANYKRLDWGHAWEIGLQP